MIPDSFKQDLLARVDVVDVISRHVELRKAGARFIGLCPFHDEKTPSFNVIPSKNFFHCFGCSANGDAIGFLMMYSGIKFNEAIKQLADSVGMQIPDRPTSSPEERQAVRRRIDAEAVLMVLEQELTICALLASDYRQGRKVSPEDHARMFQAINHVISAIEIAKQRPLTEHERRAITESKLTQQEEADLKAIA